MKPGLNEFFKNIYFYQYLQESSKKALFIYQYLQETNKVDLITFPDHHAFSVTDIQKIHTKFDLLEDSSAIILTTEKDFMRLKSIVTKSQLERYPWCYIPIRISLDREAEFVQEIKNYVDTI